MSICGDQFAVNPALNSARFHIRIVSLSFLFVMGYSPAPLGAESAVPVAVHETSWNSATRGKTSGPIQYRYRLEEREGRAFALKVFARSGLGSLKGWKIDLVEDGLKLGHRTPGLNKPIKSDSSSVITREFEFRSLDINLESVAVRVEVPIGVQLASKTFKVPLGPNESDVVETCEDRRSSCERALPMRMKIDGDLVDK